MQQREVPHRDRHRRVRLGDAGLITLEDLLEELVGEIADEYDREEPEFEPVGEDVYRVNGKTSIDDVNELLDVELPDEEWDTVAGLMFGCFGTDPRRRARSAGWTGSTFRAETVLGRRIASVLITRTTEPEPALTEAPTA